jgi:glycine/D-amino acid oxidase-like deaminating enzyme
MKRVAVLGGGLQGACVALELAGAGVAVDLYERNERYLTGASARNEGKIHLGFVYARDDSLATARTMIRGAVAFAPLLRRWLGSEAVDSIPRSAPFYYVVHEASQVPPDEVAAHLERCRAILVEESCEAKGDYFGSDYTAPAVRLPEAEADSLFDGRRVQAAFGTPEIGIDSEALAELIRARLAAEDRIELRPRTLVRAAEPNGRRVVVHSENGGGREREAYDHVVNALWDGRLAIDRTAGVAPPRRWLYRLKHYVRMRAPGLAASIPSTTVVLGPYGDVVAYDNGSVYLSWYPVGMRGMSSELVPPDWPFVPDAPASLRRETSRSLAEIIPAVAGLTPDVAESCEVGGGVIVAWGETDIDDPASELHERHAIGPRSHGRYHSVDTGKLTTAPLFAKVTADRILEAG